MINAKFGLNTRAAFLEWFKAGRIHPLDFQFSIYFTNDNEGAMLGWTATINLHFSLAHSRYFPQTRR